MPGYQYKRRNDPHAAGGVGGKVMETTLAIQMYIPIQITHFIEGDMLVLRAQVKLPRESWKRPGWPTDKQIEQAMVNAFSRFTKP